MSQGNCRAPGGYRSYVKTRTLCLPIVLLLSAVSLAEYGVDPPVLLPEYPYRILDDEVPALYPEPGRTVRLRSSVREGLLTWRLYYRGLPISPAMAGELTVLTRRQMGWSVRSVWRRTNAQSYIRRAREEGSLLPTIYLPLDMPDAVERAIGEGGQLNISGHQKITLSGITHYQPNRPTQEGESQSLFPDLKMEQELRIKLDGTIGEKINVSVDHDSERDLQPENTLMISYNGYEDEVVQSVELGDVSLSITGPEFLSYSIPHQGLFGAKVEAQVGPVDITTIGSKEASSTESAEFVGQATMYTDTIMDIQPAENYFFVTEPDTAPQPEIVSIRVFQDDLDGTNNAETGAVEGTAFLEDTTFDYDCAWDELLIGQQEDFVLEDSSYIRFINPVPEYYRVAVWYVTAAGDTVGSVPVGGPYDLKLLKNSQRTASDPTWFYELRNRYFLGANNIVQESFECAIYRRRSGEDPIPTQGDTPFIELLGLDTNGDGSVADEEHAVDWDNGFLVFPDPRPFDSPVLEHRNPEVYEKKDPQTTDSKYFISVEYRAASTTYSLGQLGIVPGSEDVKLVSAAGETIVLQKDVDYTIIYEIGMLSLMGEAAEKAQDPSYELRVRYEYLPFLAAQQKLLFGTRAVYGLGRHSWVGATMMFENVSTPEDRPRVGEESSRTFVADVDAHFEARPELLTDVANAVPLVNTEAESRVVLSGEVAASFPNPNVDGKAYIDDMEGTESSVPVGQSRMAWSLSSSPRDIGGMIFPPGEMKWYNRADVGFAWERGDIVPNLSEEDANDRASSVLDIVFTPDESNPTASWGGVMRCIDKYGIDMTKKTRIRLYIRPPDEAGSPDIYLDLGQSISEDAVWLERVGGELVRRANGELDTEDTEGNGNYTEEKDTGLDNLMSAEEPGYDPDTNPDPNQDDYGSASNPYEDINNTERNNRLDSEDLNRNGSLDTSDLFFRIRIPYDDPEYIVSENLDTGWRLVEIPLNDSTLISVPEQVSGTPTWEKVSFARIWVEGFTAPDTLELYEMSVVGNRWEQRGVFAQERPAPQVLPFEQLLVSTVNNKENPDYIADPPPGIDPGEDEQGNEKLEQSLQLEAVSIQPGHEGRATQVYYSPEDYTGYSGYRFLVHGEAGGSGEFFLRMGTDSLNYYEVNVGLQQGWQVVEVDIDDLTDLKETLDGMEEADYLREGGLAVRGRPNFASVLELSAGVRNNTSQAVTTEVWLNDITLRRPYSETGFAHRVSSQLEFADLLLLDGDYRKMGAHFHGLGQTSGQGYASTNLTGSATLNLDRFAPPLWSLSMPFNIALSRKITEPVFQPNSDIRLNPEESWENRTDQNGLNTSISLRRTGRSDRVLMRYLVDALSLQHNYGRSRKISPTYTDSSTSSRYKVTYSVTPGRMRLLRLPVLGDLRLRPTSVGWSVERTNGWGVRWESISGDTVQTRFNFKRDLRTTGSVGFRLWEGQTTNYSLNVDRDLLYPWRGDMPFNVGREVGRSQSASVSQEINLLDFLRPRVSYDAQYGSARPSPHTSSGNDSLGLYDFSLSTTRRLNLRVGLVHTIRSLARLRDERRDEDAEPGSPRWLLIKLEELSGKFNDPQVTISRTLGSDYRDMDSLPGAEYQFGLQTELEDREAYQRTKSDNLSVSGGIRPVSAMSVRLEYSNTDSRSYYSGYWNRQESTTWPSVRVSLSGVERLGPLENLFQSGSVNTSYQFKTNRSGRFELGEFIPTSKTETTSWSPLLSFTATLQNDVQLTLTDNNSVSLSRNYTGAGARTRSASNSAQVKLQYAFSAPGGLAIPLPLLDRLRVSFRSDLTTSLSFSRSTSRSEILGLPGGDQVQSDKLEWRLEPALNYDFGSVTAGLTGIYGWKKDKVNSLYDQRDVGMNVWVNINF